jgi:hypothetical protein
MTTIATHGPLQAVVHVALTTPPPGQESSGIHRLAAFITHWATSLFRSVGTRLLHSTKAMSHPLFHVTDTDSRSGLPASRQSCAHVCASSMAPSREKPSASGPSFSFASELSSRPDLPDGQPIGFFDILCVCHGKERPEAQLRATVEWVAWGFSGRWPSFQAQPGVPRKTGKRYEKVSLFARSVPAYPSRASTRRNRDTRSTPRFPGRGDSDKVFWGSDLFGSWCRRLQKLSIRGNDFFNLFDAEGTEDKLVIPRRWSLDVKEREIGVFQLFFETAGSFRKCFFQRHRIADPQIVSRNCGIDRLANSSVPHR